MRSDNRWPPARPASGDVATVWRVAVVAGAAEDAALRALLDAEEQRRAGRYLRAEDRDRSVTGHAALRRILAGVLGAAPQTLAFARSAEGKPYLAPPWSGRQDFNLSHSGSVVLVGVSPAGAIGVDVEQVRAIPDILSLARSHFAKVEIAALERRPESAREAAFHACWTRKEAFVKALGLGLSLPLDRFAVSVPPEPAALLSLDGKPDAAWSLHHLEPAAGHVGAVAIAGANRACRLCTLAPEVLARDDA